MPEIEDPHPSTLVTAIPDELADEIGWREDMRDWPCLEGRDGELWSVCPYTYAGEMVLYPYAGDMPAATRSSVEAAFGPLINYVKEA